MGGRTAWRGDCCNQRAAEGAYRLDQPACRAMNILLVEDDPGIGRFLSRGLSSEGFAVHWLKSGLEAREALKATAFVAAILDVGLPDMEGTDLCASMRREGVLTPVLMLTARDGLEDKLDGFKSGADDYLTKPFAFEELLARLTALMRRRGAEALEVGTLRLDMTARAAFVGSVPLALSRREFDVLSCLARRPGAAVRRETIIDEAWGPDAEVTENAVDVYVGYVRRRLSGYENAPAIESVRSVGFRLLADP